MYLDDGIKSIVKVLIWILIPLKLEMIQNYKKNLLQRIKA